MSKVAMTCRSAQGILEMDNCGTHTINLTVVPHTGNKIVFNVDFHSLMEY